MKKFFTLIATALVALSANADATWSWTWSGTAPTDNKETVVVDNYGTVNIAYEVGTKTDVFNSSSGVKFSGSAVTMTITLPEGKYFTDGDKFTVVTKGANSGSEAKLSVGGQLTTAHAASTSEVITSDITLPSSFAATNSITIKRDGSGTIYLKSIEYTSFGKTPVVTTTWDIADIYNADPALTDSVGEGTNSAKHYMSSQQYSLLYNNSFSIVKGTSGKVEISANSKKFSDDWQSTYRVATGGIGYATPGEGEPVPTTPTQRYITFAVTAASTINVYAVGGGTGDRTLYITDGTQVLNSWTTSNNSTTNIVSASTTGASTIYVYGSGSFNVYKVTATNAGTIEPPAQTTAISSVAAAKSNNGVVKTANYIIKNGKKYSYAGQLMK